MPKHGIPALPTGESPKFFFMRCVWHALWNGQFPFANTDTVKYEFKNGFYSFKAAAGGIAGSNGWDWMYPTHKELDPTLSYSKNKWVYVSELNPLVTTGMVDIVSDSNVISCQGLWQCVKDVPAAVGGKFNVPVFPYPTAPAIPSGTPLMGDLDDPLIYWIYRGDVT